MKKVYCNDIDITSYITSITSSIDFVTSTIIGNTPSEKWNIKLNNKDRYFTYDLLTSTFKVYDDDKLRATLFVDELPEKVMTTLNLTLYDNVLKTNVEYETNQQMYPCTIREQLDEMKSILDIEIDYSELPKRVLDQMVDWYDNAYTIRQHLGWIAELNASNVFALPNGTLKFIKISKSVVHEIVNDNYVYEFQINEDYECSSVMIDKTIKKVASGIPTKNVVNLSFDNHYISDDENNVIQEQLDYIYSIIGGLSFRSISGFKGRSIHGLRLGELVKYKEYFIMLPLSIKTTYYSGDVVHDVVEISGEMETLTSEKYSNKSGTSKKIKKLEVKTDENEQKLTILAKEQDDLNEKYGDLVIGIDEINAEVGKINEIVYKFETGNNNIFLNCSQVLQKLPEETEEKYVSDMPLDINKEYMRGKDICISVDVDVLRAFESNLGNYIGAEFDIRYADGTSKTYSARWYLGQYFMQYLLQTDTTSHQERIWSYYKIDDKEIASVSNLRIVISLNAEKAIAAHPKVEFGTTPTGFEFDLQYIRDNIRTIDNNFTTINQKIDTLTLQATSMTEQITTIKGDVSTITTRLQSAEIKLQPTNILMAINEQIGADGTLHTTKFVLDKNGVHISGGGLDISNNAGTKVFYADTNGNLVINNLTASNGNFSGVVNATSGSFTGNINATSGTFSGTITGSTISGGTINGTTINTDKDINVGSRVVLKEDQEYGINNGVFIGNSLGISYIKKEERALIHTYGRIQITGGITGALASIEAFQDCASIFSTYVIMLDSRAVTSSVQITVTSDVRKKENIREVSLGTMIDSINVKSFNYKNSNFRTVGVIAQEFVGSQYEDIILRRDKEGYYSLDYNVILMAAVQKIQSQQKEIIALSNQIANINAKLGGKTW